MSKATCTPKRKALAKRFKKGIDEGDNPFSKKENPFKKKDADEPDELESPNDEIDTEEPSDIEEPTNMVPGEEPEATDTDDDLSSEEPSVDTDIESGESSPENEKEEILLIKVLGLIAKKLDSMHDKEGYELTPKDSDVENPPVDNNSEEEENSSEEPSVDNTEEEIPVDTGDESTDEEEEEEEEELTEDAYKVVSPHSYTDAEENKALNIQNDSEVNEDFAGGDNNTCPKCKTSLKESEEGALRCDNPSCDCSRKLHEFKKRNFREPVIRQNHRVDRK